MPKLVESWWDLNDDGRTVVANNRLKCQSNGEIDSNKVYSRSTLPKATPTTNKNSTDYNTIDIIAIYNIPSTRLRKKIKRYLEFNFKPENPDSEGVLLETSPGRLTIWTRR
jgi:hypothetical protein